MVWSMERYHMYIYNNGIPVLETLNLIILFEGGGLIMLRHLTGRFIFEKNEYLLPGFAN